MDSIRIKEHIEWLISDELGRDLCPDCKGLVECNGKCYTCRNCGYSTCG